MLTTTMPRRARVSPSGGHWPEPSTLPPPWIQTRTGRRAVAARCGVQTLSVEAGFAGGHAGDAEHLGKPAAGSLRAGGAEGGGAADARPGGCGLRGAPAECADGLRGVGDAEEGGAVREGGEGEAFEAAGVEGDGGRRVLGARGGGESERIAMAKRWARCEAMVCIVARLEEEGMGGCCENRWNEYIGGMQCRRLELISARRIVRLRW